MSFLTFTTTKLSCTSRSQQTTTHHTYSNTRAPRRFCWPTARFRYRMYLRRSKCLRALRCESTEEHRSDIILHSRTFLSRSRTATNPFGHHPYVEPRKSRRDEALFAWPTLQLRNFVDREVHEATGVHHDIGNHCDFHNAPRLVGAPHSPFR